MLQCIHSLTILINLNYIEYQFRNYNEADINQAREYVCSPFNKLFALETFLKVVCPLHYLKEIYYEKYIR